MKKLQMSVGSFAVLLFSLSSLLATAEAQNITVQSGYRVVPNLPEVMHPQDCLLPIGVDAGDVLVADIQQGYKLAWCTEQDGAVAVTNDWTVGVDGNPFIGLLSVSCTRGAPAVCIGRFPNTSVVELQVKSEHTITILGRDPVTTLSAGMSMLRIRRPVCVIDGVTYEKNQPLPASLPGLLRNQQGSFTFEGLIGKYRAAGAHIEWQRVQFGLDSNGLNGYWIALGWCEGR